METLEEIDEAMLNRNKCCIEIKKEEKKNGINSVEP